MKLEVNKQYLDRIGVKWIIDYVGKHWASGHDADCEVRMWRIDGTWNATGEASKDLISEYTEPEFVPWETPQEVPARAWFRRKNHPNDWVQVYQITRKKESEDIIINPATLCPVSQIELLRDFEHSIDNGVTWLPCGKGKK